MDGRSAVVALGLFAAVVLTVQSVAKIILARIQIRVATRGQLGDDHDDRLARIEAAVDAIAVEVERIAEAQRYSLKLDEQREAQRLPRAAGDPRTNTPR